MMIHHQMRRSSKVAACPGREDIFVFLSVILGVAMLGVTALHYLISQSKSSVNSVVLESILLIGAIITLLFALPCWRRSISTGLLAGYGGVLIGVFVGYALRALWNMNSNNYQVVYGFDKEKIQDIFRFLNKSDSCDIVGSNISALSGLGLIILSVCHCLLYKSYPMCFSFLVFTLGFACVASIAILTGSAVLFADPNLKSHTWLGSTLIEGPVMWKQTRYYLLFIIVANIIAIWLVLLGRPQRNKKTFLRTSLLAIVLVGDTMVVATSIWNIEFLKSFNVPQQKLVIFTFSVASILVVIVTWLHLLVVTPNKEKITAKEAAAAQRQRAAMMPCIPTYGMSYPSVPPPMRNSPGYETQYMIPMDHVQQMYFSSMPPQQLPSPRRY